MLRTLLYAFAYWQFMSNVLIIHHELYALWLIYPTVVDYRLWIDCSVFDSDAWALLVFSCSTSKVFKAGHVVAFINGLKVRSGILFSLLLLRINKQRVVRFTV